MKAETKSIRHGLYALLGYTYARNFRQRIPRWRGDQLRAPPTTLCQGQARLDWALSQVQLNHNFTASVIYDLPFGKGRTFGSTWNGAVNAILGNWEVDVIEKITSGFPVFIVDSNNASGVNISSGGTNFNRPDQICDPNLDNSTVEQMVQHQLFCRPASRESSETPPEPRSTVRDS